MYKEEHRIFGLLFARKPPVADVLGEKIAGVAMEPTAQQMRKDYCGRHRIEIAPKVRAAAAQRVRLGLDGTKWNSKKH
jgi:hypothetical protein